MAVLVMMSFSYWFLHYDVMDSVILSQKFDFCVEISKISMLFSHIFTYTPTSNPCYYRLLEHFKMIFRKIKSFWIEGWGNRNIDDYMCAKMPILS